MAARSWCFTINNYTEEEYNDMCKVECNYIIIGKETGKEGTPHLQGYVEFGKLIRLGGLKKINSRAHWEARKGTAKEASEYCKKEKSFVEFGKLSKQGRRNDLDATRQLAHESGMRAVSRVGNAQQIKVAEKYLSYNEEPRNWVPEVIWIWGKTGLGKSFKARELLGTDDLYTKNEGSKWWCGYDGHSDVILDDFRDSWWTITEMLSLLDCYEKRVEFKGGQRQFRAKRIVVTSCMAPKDCYKRTGEKIKQLLRRITRVEEIVGNENSDEDSDEDSDEM